jgi:hypothetical protein
VTYISSEEQVATYISQAFPASDLATTGEGSNKVFEIALSGKVLIRLDNIGAEFFFPTPGRGRMSWRGIKEGSPQSVAESIARNLANAGFTIFSTKGLRIQKSRVLLSKYTCCPKCNEIGHIKIIVFQVSPSELDTEKFVSGGRGKGTNDPEIKCINCGWEGVPEDVRFARKIREKREE